MYSVGSASELGARNREVPPRTIEAGELTIALRRTPWVCELALYGELDIGSASALDSAIRAAERLIGDGTLVIDLSGVSSLDTFGLTTLLTANRRSREGVWTLALLRPVRQYARPFRILRQWSELPFLD